MSTSVVVGNGNLLVNINDKLQVTDFYYPYVGQENHLSTFINKLFFWIEGEILEVNHKNFDIHVEYRKDSLVSESTLVSKKHNLEIKIKDFVTPNENAYFRNFEVFNQSDKQKEIRIFVQNNFAILEYDIGDTVLWYSKSKCLLHYKKDRFIAVCTSKKFYQFSCAARTDNGHKGAYPDVATGELKFNPISNGSVNSCVSVRVVVDAGAKGGTDLYTVAAKSLKELDETINDVKAYDVNSLERSTTQYWGNWINKKVSNFFDAEDDEDCVPRLTGDAEFDDRIVKLYKRSILTIRTQIANNGAIIAANDGKYLKQGGKDMYSYFWPRDGANVIMPLIDCGFKELSDRYFDYASKLLTDDGYFLHKYHPGTNGEDGILGSSWHPWIDNCGSDQLPIQEDETALNLIAASRHYEKFADQEFLNKYWDDFLFPMMNFLANYRYTIDYPLTKIDEFVEGFSCDRKSHEFNDSFAGSKLPRPSYDLWEERRGITTYTCSTVYAAFVAASKLCKAYGKESYVSVFRKFAEEVKEGMLTHLFDKSLNRFRSRVLCDKYTATCIIDNELDSSLYGVWYFNLLDIDDERVTNTMNEIETKLFVDTEIGGIARRENDYYHKEDENTPGNPWFISTLWMAQYYAKKGNMRKVRDYLTWVMDHADSTGLIAEQAHPHTGHGISVKPLTWSHSEFVNTVNMIFLKNLESRKKWNKLKDDIKMSLGKKTALKDIKID